MNFEENKNEIQFTSPAQGAVDTAPVSIPGAPVTFQESKQHGEGGNSALHFFLYLTNFLSLWFVSMGIGIILYQIINKIIPDETASKYSSYESFSQNFLQFGLASVIIATPIFFIFSYLIAKYLFQGKIAENSKVRKWVTYIILFIAVAIILGNLITFVYSLLGGELALRFFFKILTILTISGAIFGYYFWDMHKKNMLGVSYVGNKIAFGLSLVAILVIFFGSFFVVDSPAEARNRKIDAQTLNSVNMYTRTIAAYYETKAALPTSLDDLDTLGTPTKGESITYKKMTESGYQLCANFKTKSSEDAYMNSAELAAKWKHDKGIKCFDEEVRAKEIRQKDPYTQLEESDKQRAFLMSSGVAMNSTFSIASMCRREGGVVTGGNGGDFLCKESKDGESSSLRWPTMPLCGASAGDLKWTVFDGDKDSWTITLTCAANPSCNGPSNAICSSKGCNFQGTCR